MMVTPHHQQQQPQVRVVAGEGKTMTPASNSDQAGGAQTQSSDTTSDNENSSSAVIAWRQNQRASLKRLEATQKLNLILPQQQLQPQQTGAHYLTGPQHQQQQQSNQVNNNSNNNKLSNCLSTPVIITSDGVSHLSHHYLSPTNHQQQGPNVYNGHQQQQQFCPTTTSAAAAAAASQQLLFDSLAHQLNQGQNGEVSLFTGLPSCTPASADRLASSAINPFFWNATTTTTSASDQQQQVSAAQFQANADELRAQNQWAADQLNKMPQHLHHQQHQQQHHHQHHHSLDPHQQRSKLTIADLQASALSPIILSPLSFLGLSPEQESWLRYGYVSPQQHPLANRTYSSTQMASDYATNQHLPHQHQQHQQQLNFGQHMQQAGPRPTDAQQFAQQQHQQHQQHQQQSNQVPKDLTQSAAAVNQQQQQQQQVSLVPASQSQYRGQQQFGGGKGGNFFQHQQHQQQLESNNLQLQQQPHVTPSPVATTAQQQQCAQHVDEPRASPAQISSKPIASGVYQQQHVIVQQTVVDGGKQLATVADQPEVVTMQASGASLTMQEPQIRVTNSNAASPAHFAGASRTSSSTSANSTTLSSSQSSRTTSRLSSYDVSPAASDLELSNAASDGRVRPLSARTNSLSQCSVARAADTDQRLAAQQSTTSLVNNGEARATPTTGKIRATADGAMKVAKKKGGSKVPEAPTPCDGQEAPVKKKSRGGRKKKQVTHEELMARKNRSKERNRVAARRCRQKRKQFLDELRDRIDQLNAANQKLQRENLTLRDELANLKQQQQQQLPV